MGGYTYAIEIHPHDGGPPVEVGIVTAGTTREAVDDVCRRVASHTPPLDLDDRYKVVTDDPNWSPDLEGSVGECVPQDRQGRHPKGGVR